MNILGKTYSASYYTILFCLLVILLPYSIALTNVVLISLALLSVANLVIKRIQFKEVNFRYILPFILLFLIYALSVLYSADTKEALRILERRLPLLLVPLLVITSPLGKKNIKAVLYAFALSVAVCCFIALLLTVIYFVKNPSEYYLEKALWYLPQTIKFHAPYLALYLVTSNIICYLFYSSKEKRTSVVLLFLINNLFLFLLSSRTALFANWVFIVALSSYYLYIHRGKLVVVLNLTVIGSLLVLAYLHVPYLHTKISKIAEAGYGAGQRVVSAGAALKVISQNPVFGVGIGDVQNELVKALPDATYADYNVHNQYLSEVMTTGLVGFILFASIFVIGYYRAVAKRDVTFFLFLCAMVLAFTTEVILSRYQGIMLFSLMYPLLLKLNLLEKTPEQKTVAAVR